MVNIWCHALRNSLRRCISFLKIYLLFILFRAGSSLLLRLFFSCGEWGFSLAAVHWILIVVVLNPCLLNWPVGSSPLSHQGSPQEGRSLTKCSYYCQTRQNKPTTKQAREHKTSFGGDGYVYFILVVVMVSQVCA